MTPDLIEKINERTSLYPYYFRDMMCYINTVDDFVLAFGELRKYILAYDAKPINLYKYQHKNSSTDYRYRTFYIPKKSGSLRRIDAPCKELKSIQTYIGYMLGINYEAPECVMGFVPNRSVVDNAARHVGKNYVFNIDLKDYFPSITRKMVAVALTKRPFHFSYKVANFIAGLCTRYTEERDVYNIPEGEKYAEILPQGSPASPILSNIVCAVMDRRLQGLAKRFGLTYTRYADDITFSSMHSVYAENGEFRKELRRLVEQAGFTINPRKTRLCKRGARQEVTGLTVNEKVNVSRKYMRNIRIVAHYNTFLSDVVRRSVFRKHYAKVKVVDRIKGFPKLENYFYGKLNYLMNVRGKNDRVARHLNDIFNRKLPSRNYKWSRTRDLYWFDTMYLTDFEIENHTVVHFREMYTEGREKEIGRNNYNLYAFYDSDGERKYISVTNDVRLRSIPRKEIMISLIYHGWRKFWLIHMPRIKDLPRRYSLNGAPYWLQDFFDWSIDMDIDHHPVKWKERTEVENSLLRVASGANPDAVDLERNQFETTPVEEVKNLHFESDEVRDMFFNMLLKKEK